MNELASPPGSGAVGYDAVAATFHWVLAVAIAVAFVVGLVMADLPLSPARLRLFNWHKWIGMAVLALSAARLAWRSAGHRPPPLPSGTPSWQADVYHGTHVAFYLLFFVVPLLGWCYTSAVGAPVVWFGWLRLPDLVPVDKPFGEEVLKPLHSAAAYALAAIVAVHVAAAMKHQFVDRDDLLARMWPFWRNRRRA
ncbi:MAG: cytochrome b [Caldimonas sp.]